MCQYHLCTQSYHLPNPYHKFIPYKRQNTFTFKSVYINNCSCAIASKMSSDSIPAYVRKLLDDIAVREQFTTGGYTINYDAGVGIATGFQSSMFRIQISGNIQDNPSQLSLICKIPPQNIYRKQYSIGIFIHEIIMYTEILPAFVKFQEEKGVSATDGFYKFPKCYGTFSDHKTFEYAIVLEDLVESGYKLWNKFVQVDLIHASLALRTLAKFHAISFALREQQPDLYHRISTIETNNIKGMFAMPKARAFIEGMFQSAISILPTNESELINRMTQLKTVYEQKLRTSTDLKSPFSVLNHGDFWVNNMFFEYSNEMVTKCSVIDWQMSQFCSPVTDVSYYLYSSIEKQLRTEHYTDLLLVYHTELLAAAKRLGTNIDSIFTFDEFMKQIKEFAIYGLLMAPLVVQAVTTEASELPSAGETEEEQANNLMGSNLSQRYAVRMTDVIRDFFSRGYLSD